jgi:hypothetical protein
VGIKSLLRWWCADKLSHEARFQFRGDIDAFWSNPRGSSVCEVRDTRILGQVWLGILIILGLDFSSEDTNLSHFLSWPWRQGA